MKLALIAGTGSLPAVLLTRLSKQPLICALEGFEPEVDPDFTFRIERLGSLLKTLSENGVTDICMAGAISRPEVDQLQIDDLTLPLVPQILTALQSGDDGALRAVISIFEGAGFNVVAAHDIARDLIPTASVPTTVRPSDAHYIDAHAGETCIAEMGRKDIGQACIVQSGRIVAMEGADGTKAMLSKSSTDHGILFKAPKPNQDRRADLPVIGIETVEQITKAGLDGIVIEAGGVMVLDSEEVVGALNDVKKFLWVREAGQ